MKLPPKKWLDDSSNGEFISIACWNQDDPSGLGYSIVDGMGGRVPNYMIQDRLKMDWIIEVLEMIHNALEER